MSKELNLLIKNSKRGNQKAQIKLYDLFSEAMFFISYRYLKNEEEAKDAMQDAFLKAFLSLDTFKEDTSFGSWLKRIVINTCIDKLKKKSIETVSLENYPLEVLDDNDWNFDVKIDRIEIIDAIESLKTKYQLVVKLYLLEGYDHSEISEILKIPIKTSRTQLRRGKLELRNLLKT
ncbi:RNA polymerase sigma factor [Polaribacter sp. R2A056_3_33]|jgi:RNA polymerase sigma-70 factor (ECF subfamily)|uniref:RNA polymerase sigma factor n=1 Tax=Polaribacter sp. R2A056_3_33 TaxID=2745563 RepID=UPI001C4F058E|nr:RNA polymerase sigma factor [Polaribacter sp. R2A056_3_33]QXP71644.1 RNA polymerase sigma factor [Polaribacter sp. R2A056_3_33]